MKSQKEDANKTNSDLNCGAAYEAAEEDFVLGYVDGCSQTNPDYAAVAPTTIPVCS